MLYSKIPNSTVVKNTARASLRGRWPESIAVSMLGLFGLLFLEVIFNFSLLTQNFNFIFLYIGFAALLWMFVVSPLMLGIVRYFWRLTDQAEDELSAAFYYFGSANSYKRAVKLTIIMLWRILCAGFVCSLPYLTVRLLSGSWLYGVLGQDIPLWAANFALIEVFLLIVGVICSVMYAARFYLVPVLAVMDENLLLLEAVHISKMVSKRSVSAFLGLACSLIIWLIISFLILPVIYTMPFVLTCYAVHCRYAMSNYNMMLEGNAF